VSLNKITALASKHKLCN